MFHIYNDNKTWPGKLDLLITNFNLEIDNRAIVNDLAEVRMNCGQKCMRSGNCRYCDTAVRFATAAYKRFTEERKRQAYERHHIIEDGSEAEV